MLMNILSPWRHSRAALISWHFRNILTLRGVRNVCAVSTECANGCETGGGGMGNVMMVCMCGAGNYGVWGVFTLPWEP